VSASTGTGSGTSYNSGNLGTLAAGASTTVTVVAMISPSTGQGSVLHDSATVSFDHDRPQRRQQYGHLRHHGQHAGRPGRGQERAGHGVRGPADHLHANADQQRPQRRAGRVPDRHAAGGRNLRLLQRGLGRPAPASSMASAPSPPAPPGPSPSSPASAPSASAGTVTNTAHVSTTTTDPNATNNTATFNTTVSTQADLALTKTGPASAIAGEPITYTLSLTNNGPQRRPGRQHQRHAAGGRDLHLLQRGKRCRHQLHGHDRHLRRRRHPHHHHRRPGQRRHPPHCAAQQRHGQLDHDRQQRR